MKTKRLKFALIAIAIIGGLISGPSALESASLAQLSFRWSDLAFVFFGCAFAILFIFGIQAIAKNKKGFVWYWSFFALGAIYFFITGASGAALSFISKGVHPYSFLFVAMGLGMAVGLAVLRAAFSNWFKDVV